MKRILPLHEMAKSLGLIPNDTRIGVKYYYNMGIPDGLNPHFVDMVFSIDM